MDSRTETGNRFARPRHLVPSHARSWVKVNRLTCLVRFFPLAIVVAFYGAVLFAPAQALAQTCGGSTFCRGPVTSPINYYQVCDGYVNCGISTNEQGAIAAHEQLLSSHYSACNVTYVDLTPGWQPPGIGNGSAGTYPGSPNRTPSFSISYTYSAETHQTQNPLKFTVIYGSGCTSQVTI